MGACVIRPRSPTSTTCASPKRSLSFAIWAESVIGLAERQAAVEAALARRHLHDGTLVLYDVSSSYVEGRRCELATARR